MTAVHFVIPDGIDDRARASGGNAYDRHLCRGLTSIGWSVHEHAVPGCWPRPDAASFAALDGVVQQIPDDAVVLLDGLVASTAPDVLLTQTRRLRLVVLVHMPLGHRPADDGAEARIRERAVLSVAAAVVTTMATGHGYQTPQSSLPWPPGVQQVPADAPALSPADAARDARLLFIMLVNDAQVEAVLFGESRAAAALPAGATVVL